MGMGEWELDYERATYIHSQLLHVDIEYVVARVDVRGEGGQYSTRQLLSYNADLEGGREREREREREGENDT